MAERIFEWGSNNGTTRLLETAIRGCTMSAELSEQLQLLSQKSGATLFMTLQGAFATLLSRYSGGKDIVIGSPIASRNRREVESLIGFFVNTLVLRTSLEENPSFEQLLQQVRETTLKAYLPSVPGNVGTTKCSSRSARTTRGKSKSLTSRDS